jgi:hypothetical protein
MFEVEDNATYFMTDGSKFIVNFPFWKREYLEDSLGN